MNIVIIGADEEIVKSYSFAGIKGYVHSEDMRLSKFILELRDKENVGLVLLDLTVYRKNEEEILTLMERTSEPLILVVPDSTGNVPDNRRIFKTLENLVGIKL